MEGLTGSEVAESAVEVRLVHIGKNRLPLVRHLAICTEDHYKESYERHESVKETKSRLTNIPCVGGPDTDIVPRVSISFREITTDRGTYAGCRGESARKSEMNTR